MTQLTLEWPHRSATGRDDFLVSESNRAALERVEAWPNWPAPGLVLYGPTGSGKTHLATLWAKRASARRMDGRALAADTATGVSGPVAVDNAERAGETALLHLYNTVVERQGSILVVASQAPGAWPVRLPDLASRLRALPAVGIVTPDDELLAAVLLKHFTDRQLRVTPKVIGYLMLRMERSFAAAAEIVQRLDRLSLSEGGAVTVSLARRLLALNP